MILAILGWCGVLAVVYLSLKVAVPRSTRKRRAWYLTAVSSVVLSACGVRNLAVHGFDLGRSETSMDRKVAQFFCAYCVTDLFVGCMDYQELLDWQAGWTHHAFYAVAILALLATNQTVFFGAGLVEEVPTVYLAYARINESSPKNSWAFALAYFVLRILYHTVATFEALRFSKLGFLLGLVVLRQHLWWFAGWWREPGLTWTLRSKLAVLASMVVVQVWTMVRLASFWLLIVVAYYGYQTIAIFVDTYTESFISLAIAERKLIYNISWEDPRVEREALKLNSEDIVLTISSAGCNVLDYLIEEPKLIVAADLNEAQLAVLDLKLACMKAKMPHSDFFALWGRSDPRVFDEWYSRKLRDQLCAEGSRAFWDETQDSLFQCNFMFCGTSGLMAYVLMLMARPLGVSGALQRNLGPPIKKNGPMFDFLTAFLSWPFVWTYCAPLIGVPPEQLALVERRPRAFSDRISEIVRKRMWVEDNYFYHGYCTGQFDPSPKCPRYMAPEFYEKLVSREAFKRVELFHGSWGDVDDRGFTFVSLLDSMDWMPAGLVSSLVAKLLPKCAPEVRVFWRSYAPGPSMATSRYDLFCPHSPALAQLEPDELESYDRVGWYLSQWVATPRNVDAACLNPPSTSPHKTYKNSLLDDLRVCWAMTTYALFSRNVDVASFYKTQGARYDGFRESLLPDRDTLLKFALPWSKQPPPEAEYVLACVGCGTARDVEFISHHLRTLGRKIALIDLSPELLDVAKQRVKDLGLDDLVDFFNVDVTEFSDLTSKCAFVTCSYCLTMIRDWRAAIRTMTSMLADGGYLGMIDFTTLEHEDLLQLVYKKWFALDGVYFDRNHVKTLAEETTPFYYAERRSRVPYTPYYPTHYLFVGQKKNKNTT
ncbi:hypothetical protein CTAYLR_003964 [Chrysophaeum taylorii]|uniref:Methyltransferase domain-containing protein n=1 Tax=Chrysophaeum taylorii TaxID=2483200 RepID=A0AAD7XM36_9STRA|nr:hypothetical protein CTAYLR_003964 [Chrysophaeum taylorii]